MDLRGHLYSVLMAEKDMAALWCKFCHNVPTVYYHHNQVSAQNSKGGTQHLTMTHLYQVHRLHTILTHILFMTIFMKSVYDDLWAKLSLANDFHC